MRNENLEKLKEEISRNKKIVRQLNNLESSILELDDEIKISEKRIKIEKKLRGFACQAIGSVSLYNKLNENYAYFKEGQFNKVVRFVQLIEKMEKEYRKLYLDCTSGYMRKKDVDVPLANLEDVKRELDVSYKFLSVLVHEVNGDVVSFNKVYNKLEDTGIFLSDPEKQTLDSLKKISTQLKGVLKGLKAIFDSIQETNKNLLLIDENISDVAGSLYYSNDLLWDISFNVEGLND